MKVEISIVIPLYNRGKYIAECLDSILSQIFMDFEVILVDNGSDDNTISIVEEYKKKDNRIALYQEEKKGAGNARNCGMTMARGKYISFLDGDDSMKEDALLIMHDAIVSSDADVVKVRADYQGNNLREKLYYEIYRFPFWLYGRKLGFEQYPELLSSIMPVCWNGLYKRDFLVNNDIKFNELICVNDRSFNIAMLLNAEAIVYLNRKLIRSRPSNGISKAETRSRHFECLLESIRMIDEITMKMKVSAKQRDIIMRRELHDAECWYKRCCRYNGGLDEIMNKIRDIANKGGRQ